MPFTVTTLQTTQQTMVDTGYIGGPEGQLIVSSGVAIFSGGTGIARLTVDGPVVAQGTAGTDRGVQVTASIFYVTVLPGGSISSLFADGLLAQVSSSFVLRNSGTINGEVLAYETDDSADVRIANDGTITGTDSSLVLRPGTGTAQAINTGTILSMRGDAVSISYGSSELGTAVLRNTGTLIGEIASYDSDAVAVDVVNNAGTMIGAVLLGREADFYEGLHGVVQGAIDGEDGNDTLAGGSAADQMLGGDDDDTLIGRGGDDDLSGEAGADLLIGGDGNDIMDGGTDADTLTGNAGDDTMLGGTGNDLMVGQDGSDQMDGGEDDDTLDGGQGNDILEGGDGVDVLRGRDGEDELAGGLGLDFYTGGQGADVFVFRGTDHAGIGATRDQILDFEQGLDLINVSGMSPGVFEFKGTGGFDTVTPNPEMRLFETATGSTIVQFDTNGDGVVDAEIRVAGVTGLTAEDFAL
ncbi:calcium-binding protein [Mameliella sp.]|uniref:calcium-binding protein n=1 Tax=Mameliella sp. TaxID=1924940 RepID=UPI003BA8DDF1